MMSVHDALEAWQAGEITVEQAMRLTSCESVQELEQACRWSDVKIRTVLPEADTV